MTNIEKFAEVFGWVPSLDEPLDEYWAKDLYDIPIIEQRIIGEEDLSKYIQHVGYDDEQCGRTK